MRSRNVRWDKAELQELYWGRRMNCPTIARQFGVVHQAVHQAMKKLGVPRRTRSEAMRKEYGRFIGTWGYVWVLCPNHPYATKRGYVREHRLVMELILGRHLLPKEIPHHINGIKDDNRPENLLLLANQAEHRRRHAKRK